MSAAVIAPTRPAGVAGDLQVAPRDWQARVRALNALILSLSTGGDDELVDLVCECPQVGCFATVTTTRTAYSELRRDGGSLEPGAQDGTVVVFPFDRSDAP